MKMGGPTQEEVLHCFDYIDGKLFWKNRQSITKWRNGSEAGVVDFTGYRVINFNRKNIKTHRLIFLYHYGYIPKYIDHIDGNPLNNKIENLRECTLQQNSWNRKTNKNNVSGIKGIWYSKQRNKWKATIYSPFKKHLGYFDTIDEAKNVLEQFRKKYHGNFANNG